MPRITNGFLHRQGATLVAVAVAFVASLGMAEAQPISRNFDRNAPAIGDAMPDVVVYNRTVKNSGYGIC